MTLRIDDIRTYFDAAAMQWDEGNRCDPQKLRRIIRLSGIHAHDSVLDLACGTGVLTAPLLETTDRIWGLDLSREMIGIARRKYEGSSVHFQCGDFYHFAGGPFDAVFLHNAYPHFGDKQRLVEHLAGVLRPGGKVVVAHSLGRERLNSVHHRRAGRISIPLRPAGEEALEFSALFSIEAVIEEPDFYYFSCVKKA